jgi:hypothetical protein
VVEAPIRKTGPKIVLDMGSTILFGTSQPTRDTIERVGEIDVDGYLQEKVGRYRSQATYIIVYKNGIPDEILFVGYSGD